MSSTTPLIQQIAQKIRDLVEKNPESRLPPLRRLAKEYGVAYLTVVRSAKLLVSQGLIEGGRGRLYRKAGKTPVIESPSSSADLLSSLLASRISKGIYRTGERLPKLSSLAKTEQSSATTVKLAMMSLQKRGYVYRQGRFWFAGTNTLNNIEVIENRLSRTILIVQSQAGKYASMFTGRPEGFMQSFATEANKNGFRMLALNLIGPITLQQQIRSLGQLYCGSLILANPVSLVKIQNVFDILVEARKPFAWFDGINIDLGKSFHSKFFAQCTFSEYYYSVSALKYLTHHGHQIIAYCGNTDIFDNPNPWQRVRLQILRNSASEYNTGIQIVDFAMAENFITKMPHCELVTYLTHPKKFMNQTQAQLVTRIAKFFEPCLSEYECHLDKEVISFKPGPERTAYFLQHFPIQINSPLIKIHHIRYLIPCLMYPGVSALITPNDACGLPLFHDLIKMGVKIPQELSMISYDNTRAVQIMPLTTVDTGSSTLGYQAFHFIARDIPIPLKAGSPLLATPFVVNGGSVKLVE